MDTTMLICIIIDIIIIAIFLWVYFSNKSSSSNTSQLETENEELKKKLAETVKKVVDNSELEGKIEKIESKYQALLKEANDQCEQLDKQLQNAIDGKLDDTVKEQLAQTEKLKKTIEDLEKEIEDNEDDISNLKKKVRLKDDDIAELQNNLSKEKKNATSLRDELSSVRQALDDKVEELKLKMGSLDFIQEILSAKEISTEDTRKLYKRIDAFESFVKGSYIDLNSYLFKSYGMSWNDYKGDKALDAKKQYIMDSCDQWTATKRKCWLDGKTTIAFVGEFSAGKTSIVNRILSQDNPEYP